MERNREGRRANMVAAAPNGLSRRRHRSGSLRDSPDEDVPVEMAEPRLRDRGLKKDRDRDRERERSSLSLRSKRRRENRIREDGGGEDTSEESVNDEEDEEDDAGGGVLRMLLPANPAAAVTIPAPAPVMNNLHHRKSFPSTGNKLFKAAPTLKAADEMIGVSVPRKARSASTKRGHDWISGGGAVVRQTSDASLVAGRPGSPPSSSNVSIRKKMKPNGGGGGGGGAPKSRPPKSSSKSSSPPNPEELEIEIAEVLYGLMTQSQGPPSKKEIASNDSTKFDSNKSSSDAKSRVSSPISNSTPSVVAPPQNSSSSHVPSSAVAPKRKRPRQVPDFSVRSSPGSSMKTEIDHQSPKTEVSSPNLENNNSGFASENGGIPFDFSNLGNHSQVLPVASLAPAETKPITEEGGKSSRDDVLTKEEASSPKKESSGVRLADNISEVVIATASSTVTKLSTGIPAIESQRDDKFQIDLMAPPPQLRSPDSEGAAIGFAEHNRMSSLVDAEMRQMMKDKEADRLRKMSKEEPKNVVKECEEKSSKAFVEPVKESQKPIHNKERTIDLQFDLEKSDRERGSHGVTCISSSSMSQNQVARHHQPPPHKATKDDPNKVINAHSSSLPLPMSVASWPGGLPSMGYVAPLQGVVSMDGNAMPATPVQPIFTQPRPKRCATHCYIARNIHYLQQFMKMNPFWPAAASNPPMFGVKPGGNINIMPSPELHLHGNIAGRSLNPVQDKGQGHANFPAKDKSSQAATVSDPAQRKQPVILQQALPPVGPNNILQGPAFIFPFNHQHQAAAVAAASVRPSSTKSPATGSSAGSSAANSASVSTPSTTATVPMSFMGGATSATPPNPMSFMGASATGGPPTAMSFNYPPNMSANETQYLAILQNNPYPFPIPATVGGPSNYRGNPHAQAMPMFNGSFYSSQMIHPSQLQQQQQQQQQQPPPAPSQPQQVSQPHQQNTSSGSSSSQKHLQMQQQRQQQQGTTINGGTASGNMQNYPASKVNRSSQQPQNFALMTAPTSLANVSGNNSNEKKQQQQPSKQQGGSKSGVDSHPPQTFAMSFAPMNGSSANGIDISSMTHNHAILQSLPESTRHNYHQIMAAAVHQQAQHQKYYRISEEAKASGGGGGSDLSNAQDDRKGGSGLSTGKSGQSIAFSRPDVTDASGSPSAPLGSSVIDSSSRNLNLASSTPERTSRSTISNSVGTPPTSHQQLHQVQLHHQQQMLQLQKQQQQHLQNQQHLARSKNPPTSNGSSYSEHLLPSSSSSVTAKFPNSLSFPQNPVQTNNSPSQSPQWKNSSRAPTSQVPSSLASSTISSPKHHPQQQQATRVHQQSHTQISFGVNQKTPNTSQGQQPSSSNNNQCPSPPMVVGSPTTSSLSKGAGGSPRTNASASTSSLSSQQQAKNSAPGPSQRSSPSILGNPPHVISSPGSKSQQQQQQQQLSKQTMQQQAQLFFSTPYMQQAQAQAQAQQPSASGYYHQRRREQSQQPPPGSSSTSSSTGMLSLSSPVSGTATTDPAKAIATAASNVKGGGGGVLAAQFVTQSSGNAHQIPAGYSYLHPVPAAVQVKPAEQKQTAGNDNLHARWQPEKK